MILHLQRYDYNLIWKPGKEMHIADCLSRAFAELCAPASQPPPQPSAERYAVNFMESLPYAGEQLELLKSHTDKDTALQLLKTMIIKGWAEKRADVPNELLPYWSFRDELSVTDGVIFKGQRIVVPHTLCPRMQDLLHIGHRGMDATLRHARDIIFWPRMTDDIKELILTCDICQQYTTAQQPLPLQCHELTERPWQRVGADLFTIKDKHYLATVDYMSNLVEVDRLYSITTSAVKAKLQAHFARYGVPDTLVTDNGPQFSSVEFATFAKRWNFLHKTSSPHHPASNGMAESAVKTLKRTLMKCAEDRSDVYEALLNLRNTPRPGIGLSPVQLMMSQRTKTILPMAKSLLQPSTVPDTTTLRRQRQIKQAALHDKKARDISPLPDDTPLRIRPTELANKQWIKRTVVHRAADRSYDVQMPDGTMRRTRVDLRTVPTQTTTRSGCVVKPVQHYGFDRK